MEVDNMPIQPWTTDLGIAGLTVSALVSLLAYVIVSTNKRDDKRNKSFQESISTIHQLHKEERREWREDAATRQDKTNEAISELTKALHDVMIQR